MHAIAATEPDVRTLASHRGSRGTSSISKRMLPIRMKIGDCDFDSVGIGGG
jgi:hypothetical protein